MEQLERISFRRVVTSFLLVTSVPVTSQVRQLGRAPPLRPSAGYGSALLMLLHCSGCNRTPVARCEAHGTASSGGCSFAFVPSLGPPRTRTRENEPGEVAGLANGTEDVASPTHLSSHCGVNGGGCELGHFKICAAVWPLSEALNPTLLQGELSPTSFSQL